MIPHKMGLPKAQLFSSGSLIPPKVHFWGSGDNEMSKLLLNPEDRTLFNRRSINYLKNYISVQM